MRMSRDGTYRFGLLCSPSKEHGPNVPFLVLVQTNNSRQHSLQLLLQGGSTSAARAGMNGNEPSNDCSATNAIVRCHTDDGSDLSTKRLMDPRPCLAMGEGIATGGNGSEDVFARIDGLTESSATFETLGTGATVEEKKLKGQDGAVCDLSDVLLSFSGT